MVTFVLLFTFQAPIPCVDIGEGVCWLVLLEWFQCILGSIDE